MSPARTIAAVASRTLDERAYGARSWARGWVVRSPRGKVMVLGTGLGVIGEVEGGADLGDASFDGTLVLASAQGLRAVDVPGGQPRRGGEGGVERWRVNGACLACMHGAAGLWTAASDGANVTVTLRDAATGALLRCVEIPDVFGESAVMLFTHPDPTTVVAWVAAGQDGQAAFLVEDDGARLRATEIPPRDRLPPVFVDAGKTFLSCGDGWLELRVWPTNDVIDDLEWADEDEMPDDGAGDDVQSVPGGYATWSSQYGRLYVVDLAAMYVVGEIEIAGHGVRPTAELYPRLHDDRTPASDFQYAVAGPDGLILTVHADTQLVVTRLDDWRPPGDA